MQRLKQVYILAFSIDYDIKLTDVEKPFKSFVRSEIIPLSSSVFKTYYKEASEIILYSDTNLIFDEYEQSKIYKFTNRREEIDLRPDHANFPGTFSQMNYVANSNTQIYYRSNQKLLEIIVRIGGFLNGVIYIASFILYLYSKNNILWQCIYSNISKKEIEEGLGLIIINSQPQNVINPKFVRINNGNRDSEMNINNNNENNLK